MGDFDYEAVIYRSGEALPGSLKDCMRSFIVLKHSDQSEALRPV